jgi:CAAX prenyl protease-like protein
MSLAAAPARTLPSALPRRLLALCAVLLAESLIAGSLPHPWFHLHQIMATPIVFAAAFLFFGRRKLRLTALEIEPPRRAYLLLHATALAALLIATAVLLHRLPPGTPIADRPIAPFTATFTWAALWYAALAALPLALVPALFPLRQLARTLAGLRSVWLYAALTTLAAMSARSLVRWVWDAPNSALGLALQQSTFYGTRLLLGLFYRNVIAVPTTHVLGTPGFYVEVAGTCSGIEGLALMLVFTGGWLIYARRELRLRRAVLLVPVALALSWLLNLVRIALLIAIGDAGHPDVAVNGFHSEAGWIMFNAIAIGFLIAVQHIRWLHRPTDNHAPNKTVILSAAKAPRISSAAPQPPGAPFMRDASPAHEWGSTEPTTAGAPHLDSEMWEATEVTPADPASVYLLPFLAVLATSLLTHAASAGFDWLYPLRLLVAVAVLWRYRTAYRLIDWRFGWLGPIAGAAIFALWVAYAHLLNAPPSTALPTALAALAPWQRLTWLAARILAAVITVPIAEELAFRGYLARRIVSPDVESVPFARLNLLGIAVSSVAFGLLHGALWPVGILSGIVFALVAKRNNRLGEAIAAHATANLLLALWVLTRGDYGLW